NMFLLDDGNSLTLIDAGFRPEDDCFALLRRSVADLGYDVDRIDRVLVTHHHPDHIAVVKHVAERRGIPVYIHPSGVPYLLRDDKAHRMRMEFLKRLYDESGCGEAGDRYLEIAQAQWEASKAYTPP